MGKGIIYYTDNRLPEPILSIVQDQLKKASLPIVSVSLKPINFGENYTLNLKPNIVTMMRQIALALRKSSAEFVFFCEHDVLYHPSHFEFTPPKKDVFYYNANIWRWKYPEDIAITYDRLICLSTLCVDRKFALKHYEARLQKISELGYTGEESRDPLWARRWGFEPGTKKVRRGGFSDDDFEVWHSKYPVIDIRHKNTYSPPKVTIDSFRHKPQNWRQTRLKNIDCWNLAKMFNLKF